MKFLLDHDVPAEIGRVLVRDGHSVVRVCDVTPRTAPDVTVFEYAVQNELVLTTHHSRLPSHLSRLPSPVSHLTPNAEGHRTRDQGPRTKDQNIEPPMSKTLAIELDDDVLHIVHNSY